MASWGFWEWLASSSLGIAAILLAVETGMRQSPELAAHAPARRARWLGFAPLVAFLVAMIAFTVGQLSQPPASAPIAPVTAPPLPKAAARQQQQIVVPDDLRGLGNEDLRLLAYAFAAALDDLLAPYFRAVSNTSVSPEERARQRREAEKTLSAGFRDHFAGDALRLDREMLRRLQPESGGDAIEVPATGLVDFLSIDSDALTLRSHAAMLP